MSAEGASEAREVSVAEIEADPEYVRVLETATDVDAAYPAEWEALGRDAAGRITTDVLEGADDGSESFVHGPAKEAIGANSDSLPPDLLVRSAYYAAAFHNELIQHPDPGSDAEAEDEDGSVGRSSRDSGGSTPEGRVSPRLLSRTPVGLELRVAQSVDCAGLFKLVYDLAVYEKAAEKVELTARDLVRDGFGKRRSFIVLLATLPEDDPRASDGPACASYPGHNIVAFGLFFEVYSTWVRRFVYLEDLYCVPSARRLGIGGRIISAGATMAIVTNASRLQWIVLTWNKRAIDVYKAMGASVLEEWYLTRISGKKLELLGGELVRDAEDQDAGGGEEGSA